MAFSDRKVQLYLANPLLELSKLDLCIAHLELTNQGIQ